MDLTQVHCVPSPHLYACVPTPTPPPACLYIALQYSTLNAMLCTNRTFLYGSRCVGTLVMRMLNMWYA